MTSPSDDSDDDESGDSISDILREISGSGSGGSGIEGSGVDIGSGGEDGSTEEEDVIEYVEVSEDVYYMAHVMRLMAALHSIVSLAMLVAYYHLKVLKPILLK